MRKNIFFIVFSASTLFVNNFSAYSQIKKENLKLGLSYGTGSQNKWPFNLKDYTREVDFYKLLFNYSISKKRKWAYEITIEPSYNIAEHQLLNKWFVKETDYEDYLEKRELYTQKRSIREYVLNLGFILRYNIYGDLSTYAIAGVGPMISDKATERLAKGYAFSDVFGLGLSYEIKPFQLDFRYSVRHISNLEMRPPNSGHNTTNIEFSVLISLW
ncbi:acyloxyacyl hydrolase [Tamlana flava]|uniref:acyloxyacyl hydrolase n=1 Tax=Tamlana flava TaxID=3158572 RepID=UPI00351B3D74